MPILKSLIPADEEIPIKVPSTGTETHADSLGAATPSIDTLSTTIIISLLCAILSIVFLGCVIHTKNR